MKQNEILNPIVQEATVPVLSLAPQVDRPSGHTSVVYLAAPDPGFREPMPLARPPRLRELLRRTHWRYEVDTAHHWTSLSLALPAREEAFRFQAWVSLTWHVQDPVTVALRRMTDVRPMIWGFLDQQLRAISRRYGIEDSGLAEEEMSVFLEHKLGDTDYGIRLGLVSVNVRPDEAAVNHLVTRLESKRAKALAEDEHALETARQKYAAELAELSGELEQAQVAHAAHIEDLRSQQDRKLAAVTADHDLALRRQRVDFYRNALQSGGHDVLVLHLSEHPEDVQTVVKMLQAGRKEEYERAQQLLQKLLDNNLINAADAEPIREHAMEGLRPGSAAPAVILKKEHETARTRTTIDAEVQKTTESVEIPMA
ncbi:hypothetical protein GCM10010435_82950 [Winogradskya consettensis]|uniref:Band 7 domain-containing protein n=1 Tax=Winogradskya consettensis TaxID=113560 RepID=A0A919VY90_9ACTN|nr:hypothetical protein [Actinoplanes consettensis]GIM79240.1 hypothetical protein Aco04nite_64520 [Actinoplanes consettensis]